MSKYISTVRFLVKDGAGDEFVARHEANFHVAEVAQSFIVKTGERTFAFVAIFDSEQRLIDARPKMIASLDSVRDLLEEISPELGVTDPASGPIVFER
ncbi:MAG: hypothetical protein CL573_07615 [Alphaproteobacteria bacterium]|nr:hypothetical protein [Alphaproteobacteria bacterium]HCP01250.1 hypothetical protein [Rhodospirillaceae bacterium]|tara:strand:- start:214 stop:507 length:294 start_codon:yes stop_codon:yes gene_type:complete